MKTFLSLIFSLLSLLSFSQKIEIVDQAQKQPLANVSVKNQTLTKQVVTDSKGYFELSVFNPADQLTISHLGYKTLHVAAGDLRQTPKIYLIRSVITLDEMVLSVNRTEEDKTKLASRVDILSKTQIEEATPQNAAELLAQTGNVFVQTSQLGGGSPVLRGMESNRVLLVVDGVRMNNAIYRAGHLQNSITLDPGNLERVEVAYGPGSVVYGSDALGGVMHFYTRSPRLSADSKAAIGGNASVKYASAAHEMAGNVSLNYGMQKWAAFVSASYKNIGDLREGANRPSKYGDWGKCLFYTERVNGRDSMFANPDPLIQKNTGYSQYDLLGKFLFKPKAGYSFLLNMQLSNSSDIPRYDRLTLLSGNLPKFAEWYYGPQFRSLVSLQSVLTDPTLLYDKFTATVAWQNISEDRIQRKFQKSGRDHQEETVDVFSMNLDLEKNIRKNDVLHYGAEAVYNYVRSKAYSENINTGAITPGITRYPDGGDHMSNLAAYATNNWQLTPRLTFLQGIRLSYIYLNANYSDEMMAMMEFPFDKQIIEKNTALNGSLGLVYNTENKWHLAFNLASGFRAPNVDDLGKLNETVTGAVMVPNPDLKPENAYSGEITIGKAFSDFLKIECTGFYCYLDQAIVTAPFTFNGQDSIVYNGTLCAVQANVNAAKAYTTGIQAGLAAQITPAWSVCSNLTYTYGRVTSSDVPMDHIPPVIGLTSVKFEQKKFWSELYMRYNGWKRLKDYSPSGEDNLTYATADGTPAWMTLNLRAGMRLHRLLSVQAGIENILDTHYRVFASGISAPGRNITVSLRSNFGN